MNEEIFLICMLSVILLFGAAINIYDSIVYRIRYKLSPLLGENSDFHITICNQYTFHPNSVKINIIYEKVDNIYAISNIEMTNNGETNIEYNLDYLDKHSNKKRKDYFFKKIILTYANKYPIYISSVSKWNRAAWIYAAAGEIALVGKSRHYNSLNKKEKKKADKISKIFFEVG